MNHGHLSRRGLLQGLSGGALLGILGPLAPCRTARAGEALGQPSWLADAQLKELAQRAIEVARDRGAQFADARIESTRYLSIRIPNGRVAPLVLIDSATIGIRAVVDGAWGFAGGSGLTPENVQTLASLATERARAGRARLSKPFEFAPAPVVRDGAWTTPIETDPFAVPIHHQEELLLEAIREAGQAKSSGAVIRSAYAFSNWIKSKRVFASTDGSSIVQLIHTAMPSAGVSALPSHDQTAVVHAAVAALALRQGGYGYEALLKANLKERMRETAEEALRIATLRKRSVDVGRYDLVLGAEAVADVLVGTVARALALDRARGDYADQVGTSYASPPADALGKYRVGSELLTVTCDRSRPGASMTVGWDEEGVRPEDFTLIRNGLIQDYITTRVTAPAIASWYVSQNTPLRSHGCATRSGSWQPVLQIPNLTVEPARNRADVQELIRDTQRGFYVARCGGESIDQQCLNAQYAGDLVYEIRGGKLAGLAKDMAFQFSSPQFWKSLHAIGGSESASLHHRQIDGAERSFSHTSVQSVPARFRQINVVNTGKRA